MERKFDISAMSLVRDDNFFEITPANMNHLMYTPLC